MTLPAPIPYLATFALCAGMLPAQFPGLYSTNNTGCAGSNGTPLLQTAGQLPEIGATFELAISNLSTNIADPAFMFTRIQQVSPAPLDALGMTGCVLDVPPGVITPLLKDLLGNAAWTIDIPDDPSLIQSTFHNQVFAFDRPGDPSNWPNAFGATTSNSGSGIMGGGSQDRSIVETFDDQARLDGNVSSARWGNGMLTAGSIGGVGIHGKFDINLLPFDAADGVFVWDTDTPIVVPSNQTLLDQGDLTIVDGHAEFSEFVLPFPQNLRFVGSHAPVIRVAGRARIEGDIQLDGQAGNIPQTPLGGTGGMGGPGGGNGGKGADGFLPAVPPSINVPNPAIHVGEDGEDLRVPAASGYAGAVAGTGGSGQGWFPASGLHSDVDANIGMFYSGKQLSGGGGGGYLVPGGDGTVPMALDPLQPDIGPIAAGGSAVMFQAPPPGVESIEHYQVGGSGGGGAGTVSTLVRPSILSPTWMRWIHGFGGAGGGGVFGIRVGGDLEITQTSTISATGGTAPSSIGNTFSSRGTHVSGGGSGGTLLFQVGGTFTQDGTLRVDGGQGGVYTSTPPGILSQSGESRGGNGAPGFVRLEQPTPPMPTHLGAVSGTSVSQQNVGVLQDRDARSAARSSWYPLPSFNSPQLQNYELRVRIDGVLQILTDDPQNPNPANDPNGPIYLLMQSARVMADGTLIGDQGPWVDSTAALTAWPRTGVRFLVIFDRSVVDMPQVEEFTLRYRG